MAEPLAEHIIKKIEHASMLYYGLVLVVGAPGSGKTSALQEVHKRTSAPFINLNLELSRLMLDLTERQRALELSSPHSKYCSQSTRKCHCPR